MILPVAALLSSCAGATGDGSGPAPGGGAPMVSVAVAPRAATVPTGGSTQFAVTVANAPDARVQWEVNRVPGGNSATGTINSNGLYLAPASVPATSVEVSAVLQTDSNRFGSASVTVVVPVSVSPRQAALTASQSLQFQAAGPSVGAAGVTWAASDGTITTDGLYIPSRAGIFTVTATSRTDSTATASATVYVTDYAGQLSWRNDPGFTGQNRQELALSPATLAAGSFGKLGLLRRGRPSARPAFVCCRG